MAQPKITNLFTITATAVLLGACAQGAVLGSNTTSMDTQTQPTAQNGPNGQSTGQNTGSAGGAAPVAPVKAFNRFPDIPVPSGAVMDVKRTIVFGGGEGWFGQLGLDTKHDSDAMFDFYKQELPGFGWQEITSVRALLSVLTYERQGRVLSIQLEKATLSGAKVTLTVSPRGGAAPALN